MDDSRKVGSSRMKPGCCRDPASLSAPSRTPDPLIPRLALSLDDDDIEGPALVTSWGYVPLFVPYLCELSYIYCLGNAPGSVVFENVAAEGARL